MKKGMLMGNFAYILECSDGTFYCGWTNDPAHRLAVHNSGEGAKYTRARRPVKLVHLEEFDTKKEAMQREAALKKLSHREKAELIRNCPEISEVAAT